MAAVNLLQLGSPVGSVLVLLATIELRNVNVFSSTVMAPNAPTVTLLATVTFVSVALVGLDDPPLSCDRPPPPPPEVATFPLMVTLVRLSTPSWFAIPPPVAARL